MPGYLTFTLREKGTEKSVMSIPVDGLVGLDTWSVATGYETAVSAIIASLSLGNLISSGYRQDIADNVDAPATNNFAQRELGLRFFLVDAVTGDKSYITLPMPDLAAVTLTTAGDEADMTAGAVATFVAWLEANAQINDGNAVTVDRVVVIGRNN